MKLSFLCFGLVTVLTLLSFVNVMPFPITINTVYLNNYPEAETINTMRKTILNGSIGILYNEQNITNIYQVVRPNLDTLYSYAVFDLDTPVTFELPPNNNYYMSLYAIDENQFSVAVVYANSTTSIKVTFVYEKSTTSYSDPNNRIEVSSTRYIYVIIRTLADTSNATDLARANALQNAVITTQLIKGIFLAPLWDSDSLSEVRTIAASLEQYLEPGTETLGFKNQISEVAHLVGTATGWGGLPNKYAIYEGLNPPSNDTSLVFQITVTTVPIEASGFWSVTVYNATGYLEENDYGSYSQNSLTVKAEDDGSYIIYFSQTKQDYMMNWIYIYPGWNYLVRLYMPKEAIINGSWTFPQMTQVNST